MSLNLVNLDSSTRQFMVEEIEKDIADGRLYESPRLSAAGKQIYPDLLRAAARNGTDSTLASELRAPGRLNATEERRKPKGGTTIAQVPVTAADTLAEGEFNRFYARGLCRVAIVENIDSVVVYRAKEVAHPRAESMALIGKALPAVELLADLRTSIGMDTVLGLPPGPNSGLSVRIDRVARPSVAGQ
jgi:hypothetical protein